MKIRFHCAGVMSKIRYAFLLIHFTFGLYVNSFLRRLTKWRGSSYSSDRRTEMSIQLKEDLSLKLKVVTFNILAPCYSTVKAGNELEKYRKYAYLERNNEICNKLLDSKADIICLQEFWIDNDDIKKLYRNRLEKVYDMRELPRTSYWRDREDGLAIFYNKDRFILQDAKDIRFHDCGDRVAQLLLLAVKPDSINDSNQTIPFQQFLIVNTHLLFPHNEASTNIRIREMSKILDYIESYRQCELSDGFYSTKCDVSNYAII
jgi:Endonuclease/Exonuclease/phosphatase family